MLQLGRKRRQDKGLVCLSESTQGVCVALTEPSDSSGQLKHCHFFSTASLKDEPQLLQDYLNEHNLQGADCNLVLAADEYQMLLVDAPNVSAQEMSDALWWRVKDLVSVDIDNAQIDYLELPEDSFKNQSKKVYAIVADKRKIAERIEWAERLHLHPLSIEVPETALLHLLRRICDSSMGVSVLYLDPQQSLLLVMNEQKLYLSRTLQYSYVERCESVVLDLQRSMDYYESQIGKAPCLKVIALPQHGGDTEIMQALYDNIGVEVDTVDINNCLDSATTLSLEIQQQCLIAIAGSLRQITKGR